MTTGDGAGRGGENLRAYLILTLVTFFWGGNAVLGRLAVGEISPMALVSARWLGATLVLGVFAHRLVRRDWPVLRKHLPLVAALGITGFTGFNTLFYIAAHYTTAVNIGIIQGSMPVFVLLGAFFLYRTRISALQIAGVVVTLAGVVIVGSGGDPGLLAALAVNTGDLLMVAACVLYAAYTLALRKCPESSALGLLALMAFFAFAASLPFTMAEAALGLFMWPTPTGWIIVALVTIFPTLLGQWMFIHGVAMIGPARAGVFINLVPVFTSILAVAILNEPFEAYHAAALALVLGGIMLSEWGKPA